MSADPRDHIESGIRAMLPPSEAAWTVEAYRRAGGTWSVELTHEASNGLGIETGDTDAMKALTCVTEILTRSREIQRVSRAPRLEHPETVAGVRTLVQAFGWSRIEVRAVVALLREVDALDTDEATWLISSFGEDKPPPRPGGIL